MKKRSPVASIVLATALVVVGCSDGDQRDGSTADAPSTTADAAAPSSDAPSVRSVPATDADARSDTATTDAGTTPTTTTSPGGDEPDDGLGTPPTSLVIDTGEGDVQISSGTVPPVARDVPLPDDLAIELSSATGSSAGFSGTTAGSVVDVAAFFRSQLPLSGFDIERDTEVGPAVLLRFSGDAGSGEVAISEAPGDGGATVIVTFDAAPRADD